MLRLIPSRRRNNVRDFGTKDGSGGLKLIRDCVEPT